MVGGAPTPSSHGGGNILMGISSFGLSGSIPAAGGIVTTGNILDQSHTIGNNSLIVVLPGESAKLSCPIPAELYGTVSIVL